MNFSQVFPSLKYLCLLQALRRRHAKQFRDLYKIAVTRKTLLSDMNISWLYFKDRCLVYKPELGVTDNCFINCQTLARSLICKEHVKILKSIVSAGCSFAFVSVLALRNEFNLFPDAISGLSGNPYSELLLKNASLSRLYEVAIQGSNNVLSFLIHIRYEPAIHNMLYYGTSQDMKIFANALRITPERSYVNHIEGHRGRMIVGSTLETVVEKNLFQSEYFLTCRVHFKNAVWAWLAVARRYGIVKDIRKLVYNLLLNSLLGDECWDIQGNRKKLKSIE